ncbi:MAG: bacteriohemerythrin [Candidatus Vogelbacteria bacterium]|nr:bacteriohemerythrin [Candidatus Vogelbacteria bacterium]
MAISDTKKLDWDDKYSVGVEEIDKQHKQMFVTINELLDIIHANKPIEHLQSVIDGLVAYKVFHFATEERYFKEFNYEETEDHMAKHREFNERLTALQAKYPTFSLEFAFELIDFLEDWLVDHLMTVDQKYVKCFHDHGLK